MKLVNLTPHTLTIRVGDKEVKIEPSGQVARVATQQVVIDRLQFDGVKIPVVATKYGEVEGVPAPQEGVIYITSSLVAGRVKRADVVAPDTGPTAIRNEQKQIVAVIRLARLGE